MKTLLILATVLFSFGLAAQGYTAIRITNQFASKDIHLTGVKLYGNSAVAWGGDGYDGHADDYPIGFAFEFFGQNYTTVDICINGWVGFNQIGGSTPYSPANSASSVPDQAYPNGMIACGWHDLWHYVMSSSDGMFAQTLGTAPNREFRVQFQRMTQWGGPGGTITFVLCLYETTNRIELHYGATTPGLPFGCGLEDQTGASGVASPDGWIITGATATAYAFYQEPEMDIERLTPIASGGSDALASATIGVAQNLGYTIYNRGAGLLNLSGTPTVALSNQVACTANVTAAAPSSVAAGANANFSVEITPTALGAFSCAVALANDDSNENPYTFTINGNATPVPTPEIEMQYNGVPVASGSTLDAGTPQAGAPATISLRIRNTGNAPLQLSGNPAISAAANCSVVLDVAPPAQIAGGAFADFSLRVTPSAPGAFSFSISVANDDSDENPYTLTVTGNGSSMIGGNGGGSGGSGGGCTAGEGLLLAPLAAALALAALRCRRK